MRALYSKTLDTPIGTLILVSSDRALTSVIFPNPKSNLQGRRKTVGPATASDNHPVLNQACTELKEYFAGERKTFSIPIELAGTDFQRKVWTALRSIPFGEHRSYGWIAKKIGNALACRAVGQANNKNPIPIIVPCHRVVGADGSLTGFSGGIKVKEWLLNHESPIPNFRSSSSKLAF